LGVVKAIPPLVGGGGLIVKEVSPRTFRAAQETFRREHEFPLTAALVVLELLDAFAEKVPTDAQAQENHRQNDRPSAAKNGLCFGSVFFSGSRFAHNRNLEM
jgi:hypothetical protein